MTATVLHPRDLLGCEHRLFLDVTHPQRLLDRPDTPETTRRKEAAATHRERVRNVLRAIHSDESAAFVCIDGPSHAARVDATLRACADEVRWIWNAALPTDAVRGRRGHAELLVWVGEPGTPTGGYVPVIVVNHRTTNPVPAQRVRLRSRLGGDESPKLITTPLWRWIPAPDPFRSNRSNKRDQLRLAQLTHMLTDLDLAPRVPESELVAGVIGLDADCIVVHPVGAALPRYREIFARRQAVAGGHVATGPRRVGECRDCRWWSSCEPELVSRRDVSLVVGGNQNEALRKAGITTIDQLARHDGTPPRDWPSGIRFDDAVVAAIAWRSDIPLVRRIERPRVVRADIEVDVDMESFGEDGAYLWGTLLTDRTDSERQVRYRPFVTWQPLPTVDEARSFAQFWSWLTAQRASARRAGKTFAAYCYSEQAENRWLLGSADRFAGLPGIPTRTEVEEFIASPEWVDIYAAVDANFVCPHGKGLKRVAPVAGFGWRDPEAGGEASMQWYRAAVGLGGRQLDHSQRRRLLEYNEDDVRATKVLREWMDGEAVIADVPFEADLMAFRLSDPGGSKRVQEGSAAQQGDRTEQE
ncbi:MAG: TM0106 family RecB-like putative nuclease [Gordonia sp. (in: high G+C Gram-positive bacteria)]